MGSGDREAVGHGGLYVHVFIPSMLVKDRTIAGTSIEIERTFHITAG